jgi:hypothetical protein
MDLKAERLRLLARIAELEAGQTQLDVTEED